MPLADSKTTIIEQPIKVSGLNLDDKDGEFPESFLPDYLGANISFSLVPVIENPVFNG